MDPTTTCCPKPACPARGQGGQGNIGLHSRKDKRFICTECRKTFAATQGTAFYRLRTPAETGALVLTLLAHGGPRHAIVVACGYDERTVAAWEARAGRQGHAVQEQWVEQPRDLGHVQADAIRVKTQGGIVWMARAMRVKTRLWLAGEVSEHRDMPLIRALIKRVRRCVAHRPLLCCTDGFVAYIRALRETLREPQRTGAQGRPRLRPWRNVCVAQGVKRSAQRRVVDVERRIVEGTPARVETLRRRSHGDGVMNTASIERLNAPLRERLASLTRRGRAFVPLMRVSALRAPQRQLWPPGSRIMAGVYKNYCRIRCRRLLGPHPSSAGVPHMHSNASVRAGAETTVSCGATARSGASLSTV
jgi:transposase-like protein/IS1 family transposase